MQKTPWMDLLAKVPEINHSFMGGKSGVVTQEMVDTMLQLAFPELEPTIDITITMARAIDVAVLERTQPSHPALIDGRRCGVSVLMVNRAARELGWRNRSPTSSEFVDIAAALDVVIAKMSESGRVAVPATDVAPCLLAPVDARPVAKQILPPGNYKITAPESFYLRLVEGYLRDEYGVSSYINEDDACIYARLSMPVDTECFDFIKQCRSTISLRE